MATAEFATVDIADIPRDGKSVRGRWDAVRQALKELPESKAIVLNFDDKLAVKNAAVSLKQSMQRFPEVQVTMRGLTLFVYKVRP